MGLYDSLVARYGEVFTLQDDGDGPYIKAWDSADPQPTPEQIAAWVAGDALGVAQAQATIALREAYEAHLAPYRVEYGGTESDGWPKQLEIARAIVAGTATPEQEAALASFCDSRGAVSPRESEYLAPLAQAQRILNNDAVWSAIYFPATGRRNGYQDQINAAQDAASVPQGPWEF
jgi:hypothetical protein